MKKVIVSLLCIVVLIFLFFVFSQNNDNSELFDGKDLIICIENTKIKNS